MFLVFFMPLMELIVTQTQHFATLFLPINAILQLIQLVSALDTADYLLFRRWIMGSFSTYWIDLRCATSNGRLPQIFSTLPLIYGWLLPHP